METSNHQHRVSVAAAAAAAETFQHWQELSSDGSGHDAASASVDAAGAAAAATNATTITRDEARRVARDFFSVIVKECWLARQQQQAAAATSGQGEGDDSDRNNNKSKNNINDQGDNESSLLFQEMIALLIQQLGPALVGQTSLTSRAVALSYLVGALEAAAVVATTTTIAETRTPLFGDKNSSILATFLLGYCGPIQIDSDGDHDQYVNTHTDDDYDDGILRDTAILALTFLLQASISPTTIEPDERHTDFESKGFVCALQWSRQAVQRRCAVSFLNHSSDDNLDTVADGQQQSELTTNASIGGIKIVSGLSTLPRSRRSLCFNLLRAAVDSVMHHVVSTSAINVRGEGRQSHGLVSMSNGSLYQDLCLYMIFVCRCLQGESDPRCLMQLLDLIHAMLQAFSPLFLEGWANIDSTRRLVLPPIIHIFEACAPYYPILFTPPPNDPFGITREGLQEALMRILCWTELDDVVMRQLEQPSGETMLRSSLSLFLERLTPPSDLEHLHEGDSPLLSDRLEALKDLWRLLFPNESRIVTAATSLVATANSDSNLVRYLSTDNMRQLAGSLLAVHEKASSEAAAVSAASSNDNYPHHHRGGVAGAKELADGCGRFLARLAYETELISLALLSPDQDIDRRSNESSSASLWNAFVVETLQSQSTRLLADLWPGTGTWNSSAASSSSRYAIASMAFFASSGGSKTLQASLEAGLRPLLKFLESATGKVAISSSSLTMIAASPSREDLQQHPDGVATALYGVGAFFASCRVTVDQASAQGVTMDPHPLQSYIQQAIDCLYQLLSSKEVEQEQPLQIRVAAIRAMESVLLASPGSQVDSSRLEFIVEFVRIMTSYVVSSQGIGEMNDQTLITTELGTSSTELAELQRASALTLGNFLGKAMKTKRDDADPTCGSAMATALEEGPLQQILTQEILPVLVASAKSNCASVRPAARSDRKVLALACAASKEAAVEIVETLVEHGKNALDQRNDHIARDCFKALASLWDNANACVAFHNAFDSCLASLLSKEDGSQCENLEAQFRMSTLELPPTDENYEVKRSVARAYSILPYLLKPFHYPVSIDILKKLVSKIDMVMPPLSDRDIINASVLIPFFATSLQHAVVPTVGNDQEEGAVFKSLASMTSDLARFALTGDYHPSARMYAGQSLSCVIARYSASSTDCPVQKILETTMAPYMNSFLHYRTSQDTNANRGAIARSCFADCLGLLGSLGSAAAIRGATSSKSADQIAALLINLACKGLSPGPFGIDSMDLTVFNQANAPIASNELAMHAASLFGSMIASGNGKSLYRQRLLHVSVQRIQDCLVQSSRLQPPLGAMLAAAHVICTSQDRYLTSKQLDFLSDLLVLGLGQECALEAAATNFAVLKMTLAAVLKLLSVQPMRMVQHTYVLVVGSLRAFALAGRNQPPGSELVSKLIALQLLEALSRSVGVGQTLTAVKPAVVSILASGMNHSSSLLRHAAVDVRNAWYLLEER